MPVNRNALIRYKTIDNCLRNPYRRWTLEDLVDACSDALYEYEGIDKGISKRAVQMDIQMMRSEKLGYNAPIVVYENKYYKYGDKKILRHDLKAVLTGNRIRNGNIVYLTLGNPAVFRISDLVFSESI